MACQTYSGFGMTVCDNENVKREKRIGQIVKRFNRQKENTMA